VYNTALFPKQNPFYGTTGLMVIGFLAIALFLEPVSVSKNRTSLKEGLCR
jgi:hypothetical protein